MAVLVQCTTFLLDTISVDCTRTMKTRQSKRTVREEKQTTRRQCSRHQSPEYLPSLQYVVQLSTHPSVSNSTLRGLRRAESFIGCLWYRRLQIPSVPQKAKQTFCAMFNRAAFRRQHNFWIYRRLIRGTNPSHVTDLARPGLHRNVTCDTWG